jgi:uncharacterized repeat protein (TIGR03837 family)
MFAKRDVCELIAFDTINSMWDLFCRVVDNFGDIGVSWRLARAAASEHGATVRLWVDDLDAFARIESRVDPAHDVQRVEGVQVRRWDASAGEAVPGEAVIEAFGCALPERFVAAMAARRPPPVWVNLEYLTAEPFAAEWHRLPSPHPRLPLVKHFYFPGFEPRTGGLLRERGLFAARDAAQHAPAPGPLRVSVFAYETAAFGALLDAWARGDAPIECLVPAGLAVAAVEAFLGRRCEPDAGATAGALQLRIVPFADQAAYDRLLWSCDWNFVRGEDSFVRAQWAARPLVWQPYPQADGAHVAKLDAFLARYTAVLPPGEAAALRDLMHAWNEVPGAPDIGAAWRRCVQAAALRPHARAWAAHLAAGPELGATLAEFIRAGVR